MLFQSRSLATAVYVASQFLLSANMPQYIILLSQFRFFTKNLGEGQMLGLPTSSLTSSMAE
jgi:hypothetical protein